MENLWVTVKEELVALDNVVITQLHLLAVVCARSQTPDPCFGIPGSQPVWQMVHLQQNEPNFSTKNPL